MTKTLRKRYILETMLNVRLYNEDGWGSWNYYAAAPGTDDFDILYDMELHGLVEQGRIIGNAIFFSATESGCRMIGLNDGQVKRIINLNEF